MSNKGNRRYIITEISGQNRIFYMNKCNFCPFFKISAFNKMSKCDHKETFNEDIEHIRAYTFGGKKGKYIPLGVIDTPNFCKLPTMVSDIITEDMVNKIQIISDKYVEFDENFNLVKTDSINFVSSQKNTFNQLICDSENNISKKSTSNTTVETPQTVEEKDDPIPTKTEPSCTQRNYNRPIYKIFERCSCCGKMYKSVERYKNDGMCETCIETYSDDEEKVQFAKMNNFRLKRKSDFSEIKYKIIV